MSVKDAVEAMQKQAGGMRSLAEKTGVSRQTLYDITKGKQKAGPLLETIKELGKRANYDMHLLAHYSFDLPDPEKLGELDELLQELCDRIMNLGEEDRKNVLTYVKTLARMREEEGSDAKDKAQDAQAGFG